MIKHIVLFRLNDIADVPEAVTTLRGMEGKIPSVRSLEVGVDFLRSERSYDVSIMTTFDDRDGLQEYADHPEHQPVIQWMRAHTKQSVAIDYEA